MAEGVSPAPGAEVRRRTDDETERRAYNPALGRERISLPARLDVSLEMRMIGLVGRGGSGKTTLITALRRRRRQFLLEPSGQR